MKESSDDNNNLGFSPIDKYEQMLISGGQMYFDVEEMEEIVDFYLESEESEKALRACDFGLSQHPTAANLMIYKSEAYYDLVSVI